MNSGRAFSGIVQNLTFQHESSFNFFTQIKKKLHDKIQSTRKFADKETRNFLPKGIREKVREAERCIALDLITYKSYAEK